jgi:SAM-dependent methyltransferase
MTVKRSALTAAEARRFYDRFGAKEDSQGFYGNPALDDLLAHAGFESARAVFEFGCGTGKLAARLLGEFLPPSATYLGSDVSPVMVALAERRLKRYGARARVVQTDGSARFPIPDRSVDRVVSTYVLDLLSEEDTRVVFAEARRALAPDGRLCLASLTAGKTGFSRVVTYLWTALFRASPSLIGGCRPVILERYLDRERWRVEHKKVVAPFGVPSEVLVLAPAG